MNNEQEFPVQLEVLGLVKKNLNHFPPLVQLCYYTTSMLLDESKEDHFFSAKKILEELSPKLEKHDCRHFLGFLINYCNKKVRRGNFEFRLMKIELFETGLKENIWIAKIYLSTHQFVTHFKSLLEAGHIDKANQFVEKYRQTLNPKDTEEGDSSNILNLCESYRFYYLKDYDQSLVCLNAYTNYKDTFYYFYVRILTVKLFYEQKTFPLVANQLKAMQSYMIRNEVLSSTILGAYNNFRKITLKLIRKKMAINVKLNANESNHKLLQEVQNADFLVEREWLKEKISDLLLQ